MTADSFQGFILDQLSGLRALACRAMFGGYGLYCGERFFGILFNGRLYFKVDSTTLPRYQACGMHAFRPSATMTLKSYYEVPVDVLEDAEELLAWARAAIDVQHRAPSTTRRRQNQAKRR